MCNEKDYIGHVNSNQILENLRPDTYYRVELRAHNIIGYSPTTNVYVKTARGELVDDSFETLRYHAGFDSNSAIAFNLHMFCVVVFLLNILRN